MKSDVVIHRSPFFSETALIGYLLLAKLLFHLLLPEYGYHRDELYYIAIGDGFRFSNLDMPPVAPLSLRLLTLVFGHSLKVVHFVAALYGALSILVACLITKELGGRKYAVVLSGIFLMFSTHLAFGSIYSYDDPGMLIWVTALLLMIKILKAENPARWLGLGLVLGIGFLTKLTIAYLGLAIFVSLWLVPQRSLFTHAWIWIAGVLALLFSLPFVFWQTGNDWYFVDFAGEYVRGMSYDASFAQFLFLQIQNEGWVAFPVWLGGLGLLLFASRWKTYRLFAFCYLFLFVVFFFTHAPFYFLLPLYTVLVAVGLIELEAFLARKRVVQPRWRLAFPALPAACVVLSLPLLPMVVPILPIGQFIPYAAALGVNAGIRTNSVTENQLPQHVADRFGWPEMAGAVARVYHDARRTGHGGGTGIIAGNYGEASALHFYRGELDLPEPISMHGWFYFETLRDPRFLEEYVAIGVPLSSLHGMFTNVEQRGLFTHPYCIPYEDNQPIYLCRQPKGDLKNFWRRR